MYVGMGLDGAREALLYSGPMPDFEVKLCARIMFDNGSCSAQGYSKGGSDLVLRNHDIRSKQ